VGSKVGLWAIPVVWAIFPTMHVSHGIGMLQGLVKYTLSPKPPVIESLDPPRPPTAAAHEAGLRLEALLLEVFGSSAEDPPRKLRQRRDQS